MRFARQAVIGGLVITTLSGAAVAYAAAPGTLNAIRATKSDTIVTTGSKKILSFDGNTWKTIATISLPPGAFVVQASGNLVNFGPSDFARCEIAVKGQSVAIVTTMVGDPTATGTAGPSGLVSAFTVVAGVRNGSKASELASLRCEHDSSFGASVYVDPGATLWAHQSGGLTLAKTT